jgi:hypothetical protein
MTWGRAIWAALLLLPCMALVGCAAAQAPNPGSIQEVRSLQSDMEAQQAIAASGDCAERCRAVASICDSAGRICEVSSDLAEVEALESCRRAEAVCIEVRRRVGTECDCR